MIDTVIEVNNLTKYYTPKRKAALKNVTFKVSAQRVCAILGPNGAGKTTLIKILLGIIPPSSGEVKILGLSPASREAKEQIGFLSEFPYYPENFTPKELLRYYAGLFNIKTGDKENRIKNVLKLVGLEEVAEQKLRHFSKGMLQRFGIAQCLLNNPKLLILDEPMGGLDPQGQKNIRDIILNLKGEGKTILFSSHQLTEAEMVCDEVVVLKEGETIIQQTLETLLIQEQEKLPQGIEMLIKYPAKEEEFKELLPKEVEVMLTTKDTFRLKLSDYKQANSLLGKILPLGGRLISFRASRITLEDIFLEIIKTKGKQNETSK